MRLRSDYIGVLNYIRSLSSQMLVERNPNEFAMTFEERLREVRNLLEPGIGRRFLREDIYTANTYQNASTHEKLMYFIFLIVKIYLYRILKEVFAMYLMT